MLQKSRPYIVVHGEEDGLPEQDLGGLIAHHAGCIREPPMDMLRRAAPGGMAVLFTPGSVGEQESYRDAVEKYDVFGKTGITGNELLTEIEDDSLLVEGLDEQLQQSVKRSPGIGTGEAGILLVAGMPPDNGERPLHVRYYHE